MSSTSLDENILNKQEYSGTNTNTIEIPKDILYTIIIIISIVLICILIMCCIMCFRKCNKNKKIKEWKLNQKNKVKLKRNKYNKAINFDIDMDNQNKTNNIEIVSLSNPKIKLFDNKQRYSRIDSMSSKKDSPKIFRNNSINSNNSNNNNKQRNIADLTELHKHSNINSVSISSFDLNSTSVHRNSKLECVNENSVLNEDTPNNINNDNNDSKTDNNINNDNNIDTNNNNNNKHKTMHASKSSNSVDMTVKKKKKRKRKKKKRMNSVGNGNIVSNIQYNPYLKDFKPVPPPHYVLKPIHADYYNNPYLHDYFNPYNPTSQYYYSYDGEHYQFNDGSRNNSPNNDNNDINSINNSYHKPIIISSNLPSHINANIQQNNRSHSLMLNYSNNFNNKYNQSKKKKHKKRNKSVEIKSKKSNDNRDEGQIPNNNNQRKIIALTQENIDNHIKNLDNRLLLMNKNNSELKNWCKFERNNALECDICYTPCNNKNELLQHMKMHKTKKNKSKTKNKIKTETNLKTDNIKQNN